jgi:hypothetical protein
MRNTICNKTLKISNSEIGFSIITLYYEWKNNSNLQKLLKENDLFPNDKMDIDPVKNICSLKVTEELKKIEKQDIQFLCIYLENMNQFYNCWNNNEVSLF